jgi:aminoglycoside 6'-N-acetyltransferase I
MVTVRRAASRDLDAWVAMRCSLWPDGSPDEHRGEAERWLHGRSGREPWAVLLAEDDGGRAIGFAEVSIRGYAEGCHSERVAYLEGWFVVSEFRGEGVGAALFAAAEAWARAQGCTEFASDAEPDNEVSRLAHRAVGFTEVGLVRCFRKSI